MINIPKGTKDILPSESYKWHKVREVISNLAYKYNLKEIVTPIFEHTELFNRSVGDSSDIVNKEMYTFLDKGERSITLKPEGTAGVVRAFVENGLFNEPMPIKTYYITPCFRYEKPQAGRLRQHTQFGMEMFGVGEPYGEVEALSIVKEFYNNFGINPTFVINNLGCDECNAKYKIALKQYLEKHINKLCPDCVKRLSQNPLRVLDCKVDSCKEIVKSAPKLKDYLCNDCNLKFNQIKNLLSVNDIMFREDTNLVRGLDYYTKFVFEIIDEDKKLGQNALGGGGRYDKLVAELGGKSTPVIGFGLGIERLLLYLESKNIHIENKENVKVYVANITDNKEFILKFIKVLRANNISCEYDLIGRSLKSQFKYADKLQANYVITIGDDEIKNSVVAVKNMFNGVQEKIALNKIVDYLK